MKNDTTPKISKNRQAKEAVVAELKDKVGRSKAIVLTNYQGMTHKQLEEFKKGLKAQGAELVVTKNTLLKIAIPQTEEATQLQDLNQPTAALFAYDDAILPLKELAKSIKAINLPAIKFGIFEGRIISDAEVTKLSTLPSRETLIAQTVGGLKAPLYGIHRALNWNLQKLVMTLAAVQAKKS